MKHTCLVHQFAKQRMTQREDEGEPPLLTVDMADRQRAGSQEPRPTPTEGARRQEIMVGTEVQNGPAGGHSERDPETVSQVFLEPRWPGETFYAMNDLL